MAYIGTSPSNGVRRKHTYTATANQTSFTGAGAEGATLSYNDSNFVDVYQNGVKLSEADYTSTSGTAIVLATGATVSDMVEIVVYDVFSVADTVSKADGGTFDGNITAAGTLGVTGNTTVGGTLGVTGAATLSADASVGDDLSLVSDGSIVNFGVNSEISLTHVHNSGLTLASSVGATTFKIGRAGATDAKVIFDGNAQDYHIGVDDTNDSLVIGLGGTLGTTDSMRFDANGIIVKPLQPCFSATSDTTNIPLTTTTTIALSGERFDVGDNVDSNTFTAPVTGKYLFTYMFFFTQLDADHTGLDTAIKTSNKVYAQSFKPSVMFSADANFSISGSVLADMDANDTCFFTVYVQGGAQQTDIHADSQVSGVLIC